MIHFPETWLKSLQATADTLAIASEMPIEQLIVRHLPNLELNLHTSLFCVRKIEESVGVPLNLDQETLQVLSWPITPARKTVISRTPDPCLEKWYNLQKSEQQTLSYKRLIDIFIHARLCNFAHFVEDGKNSVFVSSDHTMVERIFLVSFNELETVIRHTLRVFEPIVVKRKVKAQQKNSPIPTQSFGTDHK